MIQIEYKQIYSLKKNSEIKKKEMTIKFNKIINELKKLQKELKNDLFLNTQKKKCKLKFNQN